MDVDDEAVHVQMCADAADASTSNATNARLDLAPGESRYAAF